MTLAPTTSPMEFFQSEKQRIMGRLFPQQQEQQGGEAYGGDLGGREADRMRAGGAPFSAAGIGAAMGNAFNAVTGATSPMGLAGMGLQATGLDKKTVLGESLGSIFGGGFQSVPGRYSYDQDLMDMVRNSPNPIQARIEADRIQRERNLQNAAKTTSQRSVPSGRGRMGGMRDGFGRGPSGGSVRGGVGAQGGAGVGGGYGGGPGGTGRGPK